tara:strand:+ start:1110 stop:1370 length:261 start_codon:yes stop_codon:yes gene_type:complete
MNINILSEIIKKKISNKINYDSLEIQDKTYLHAKHKSHEINKFHIKLILKSDDLSKISKISSTRKIYKVLKTELNKYIHSIQIEII